MRGAPSRVRRRSRPRNGRATDAERVRVSALTERLLQLAAVGALLYFGYVGAERTVLLVLQANQRAAVAEQRAAGCQKPGGG